MLVCALEELGNVIHNALRMVWKMIEDDALIGQDFDPKTSENLLIKIAPCSLNVNSGFTL